MNQLLILKVLRVESMRALRHWDQSVVNQLLIKVSAGTKSGGEAVKFPTCAKRVCNSVRGRSHKVPDSIKVVRVGGRSRKVPDSTKQLSQSLVRELLR